MSKAMSLLSKSSCSCTYYLCSMICSDQDNENDKDKDSDKDKYKYKDKDKDKDKDLPPCILVELTSGNVQVFSHTLLAFEFIYD